MNVALDCPVSVVAGSVNGAALETIVDGIELRRGGDWTEGTVWWNGTGTVLEIDLGSMQTVNGLSLQGDNNDAYRVEYRDTADNTWHTLADADHYGGHVEGGIVTRPDYPATDTNQYIVLETPVSTDRVRVSALWGDDSYSVSEVKIMSGAIPLSAPIHQKALAQNAAVQLNWQSVDDSAGLFQSYRIYRSTDPITSVAGLSPIASINTRSATSYLDTAVINGTSYYYAITTLGTNGESGPQVTALGPRRPIDETDLQVVSVARSPNYDRYEPTYSGYEITEPGGFGPYYFSAATGLGGGQTPSTQRWPGLGQTVTYTATIRNRGTNLFAANVATSWSLDGSIVQTQPALFVLAPGAQTTLTYTRAWDGQSHELTFQMSPGDARPENNTLTTDTRAVQYLTYLDRSFIEDFRDAWSPRYGTNYSDDLIDWLNHHMTRFNEMFENAGVGKRVGYGVLSVLDDTAPTPSTPATIGYAIFPLRYRTGVDNDPRAVTAYMDWPRDIDNGLLHEMGHQLGLIDIYQYSLGGSENDVSGLGYAPEADLMFGCSGTLSDASALAMQSWIDEAHGYYGQYLYDLPQTMRLHLTARDGSPLAGATVSVYQLLERPGVGKRITDQVKFALTSDANGYVTLPNVDIDPLLVPPVLVGNELHDNPFGYLAVVGGNGLLHFKVDYGGETDYAWLDIGQANVAYWKGATTLATFERPLGLGGPIRTTVPADFAEDNASDWFASSDAPTTVTLDSTRKLFGDNSIHMVTQGGFDTLLRYPGGYNAQWNLTNATEFHASLFAQNTNDGFQDGSPWLILRDLAGHTVRYDYYRDGGRYDLLNEANGQWLDIVIPLDPGEPETGWRRTIDAGFDWTNVHAVDLHSDTWGYGFDLWVDGAGFDLPIAPETPVYEWNASKPALTFGFNADVEASLSLADLTIERLSNHTFISAASLALTYDRSRDSARITFPGLAGGALPDGWYRATIAAGTLVGNLGNALTQPITLDFRVLAGDATNDGVVNFDDLLILAQNYGQTGKTFAQGNFDYSTNGNVNFDDLLILAQRYGTSLAMPAPALPKKAVRRDRAVSVV